MKIVIGCILLAVAMMACSGDGDGDGERILRLATGDVTEEEFRMGLRSEVLFLPAARDALCTPIRGLSDEEATDVILLIRDQIVTLEYVQEPDRDDQVRATAILREECDRLSD